jgi:hypothetical protein
MSFSRKIFTSLIDRLLSAGYEFRRLDEAPLASNGARVCFLRHDVDLSPRSCLWMGKITADKGVRSSCFFQLNAETYNVFRPHTLAVMNELRSMGHCVGLHIDQNLIGDAEEAIARTIAWFSAVCCPIDHVISFHRPTPQVLGREYNAFRNAYGSEVFHCDRYASDSARNSEFLTKVEEWIRTGTSPVQLLLHPEWWHLHEPARRLWIDLRKRRQWELETYVVDNFRKVFENVIQPSEGEFTV